MSRITGSDALKMFEAYAAVYAPEEVVEEQVEEEIEQLDEAPQGVSVNAGGVKVGVTDPKTDVGARAGRAITGAVGRIGSALGQFGRSAETAIQRAGGYKVSSFTPSVAKVKPAAPTPAAAKPAPTGQTVAAAGGKGGSVTVGRQYAATQGGVKGNVTYDAAGKKTFTAAPSSKSAMSQWATANKPMIQKVGTPQQKDILKSVESGGKTPMPAVRPISQDIADLRAMRAASQLRQQGANVTSSDIKNVSVEKSKPTTVKSSYEYDAYDLVLEYLLSNGHVGTVDEAHYVMLEMDAQMIGDIVEETLQEKLKPGTKGRISFATGRDSNFNQAMTEKNPRTGRQRATSPELKAIGAHSRAKLAQYGAENRGDTEAAGRHETRRGRIAHTVYRKTGRIIDRADND